MIMYKTDSDIEKEFENFTITSITFKNRDYGYIEIEFPNAEESVGGGTDSVCDSFIIYDSGKIAFNNWYPDYVYNTLVNYIRSKRP